MNKNKDYPSLEEDQKYRETERLQNLTKDCFNPFQGQSMGAQGV